MSTDILRGKILLDRDIRWQTTPRLGFEKLK